MGGAAVLPHVGSAGFEPCRAIAVLAADKPVAGIIYHDYSRCMVCQISMASTSPFWAKPQTIMDLLAVPFLQYRCRKVWTFPSDNERAIRFGRDRHGAGGGVAPPLRPEAGRMVLA